MEFRDENVRFARQFDLRPGVFKESVITVELGTHAARRYGNVAAFLLVVNLLIRVFERVHVIYPLGTEVRRHPWHLKTIDAVINELQQIEGGSLEIRAPERTDVVLSIGDRASVYADREVIVSGSEWCAALDCELEDAGDGMMGSLYAATMGAAQVLLHTLESAGAPYRPMAPHVFSILDLMPFGRDSKMPGRLCLPETHLVGVGAVGSAAVYTLAHLEDVGGNLHLIDNEAVDHSNLNRYVLMRRGDIDQQKVDIAAASLKASEIQTLAYCGPFARYMEEHGSTTNLLLTPVDSEEGRRNLARMLPKRVINAATGGTTVTISAHGFADGKACLHCLYMQEPNEATPEEIIASDMGLSLEKVRELILMNEALDMSLIAQIESYRGIEPGRWTRYQGLPVHSFYQRAVCGDAPIQLPNANVVAPLSFISAAAGILLASELVKGSHPDLESWVLDNYLRIDTLHLPNPAFRQRRLQHSSGRCICQDHDYVAVYRDKYSDS